MDIYIKEKIKQIKACKDDKKLAELIDSIYEDGENFAFYCASRTMW